MRIPVLVVTLVLVACSGSTSPNAPTLLGFDYNETKIVQAGDLPYDSVRVDVGQLQVERRYAANLCGSALDAAVSASGSELTVRVSQNPIASCGAVSGLITWRGSIQLLSGTWRLTVREFNGATPSGAVVLDQSVTVPSR